MECPHCHQTLSFLLCSNCGKETPEASRYCNQCGRLMETIQKKRVEEHDFSDRTACSDGTCIGIINEKGVCNICGQPYTGDPT
jgi:hypothetical protein